MAFSSSTIPAKELSGYDNDFPILIGKNILSSVTIYNGSPIFSVIGPDVTDTSNPSRHNQYTPMSRIYDGYLDIPCTMKSHYAFAAPMEAITNSSNEDVWLSFFFPSDIGDFDTVIMTGHNANSDNLDGVSVLVSDNHLHSSGDVISDFSLSANTNVRLVDLSLGSASDPKVYTGVKNLAVKWTTTDQWSAPRVGELVIGKRRQLNHNPEMEWNDHDAHSKISTIEMSNGEKMSYTLNKGQASRIAVLQLSDTDEVSAVETWWEECNHGSDSFWWIETPKTDPKAYYMKVINARLDFPQTIGSDVRTLTIEMVEEKPFLMWEKDLV